MTGPASVRDVMRMTPAQARYYLSEARYNVAACGRRSGKTAIAKRRGVRKALTWGGVPGARFIFAAPTQMQAKTIFWRDVKALIPREAVLGRPSESELSVELVNGAIVQIMGLDRPERAEGTPVGHIAIDEFANVQKGVWDDHVRPMLTDTGGTADVFGVPEGRNHYWDLWNRAVLNDSGEWAAHRWITADVLPMYLGREAARLEMESARAAMDSITFRQEYEASFDVLVGRIYYDFSRDTHAARRVRYDPSRPVAVCFDFNVSPGVAAYVQELGVEGETVTGVIGEVYIPRDSNTAAVCRRVVADLLGSEFKKPLFGQPHAGDVLIYGDPAGGARSTQSERGSDWDVIRQRLKLAFGDRLRDRVARSQPLQRVRVNTLNSRIQAADGTRRLLVDPVLAPRTVDDLEFVTVKEGTDGEIDKDKDDGRYSHLSDALGYYCLQKHPLGSVAGSAVQSM